MPAAEPADTHPHTAINTVATQLLERYQPSSRDPHVRFVLGELAPAHYAFNRSLAESGERPLLGHLMFTRLVAEEAIRFGWIGRDIEQDGSAGIRASVDALLKRDLMFLQAANKALRQVGTTVERDIARIAVDAAPATLRDLSAASPITAGSYAVYRFASAMIHPGVGLRDLMAVVPEMEIGLRDSILSCVVLAADVLAELDPPTERIDVEQLLRQPVLFGFSPTALAHRLRRDLRKLLGPASPKIANSGLSFRLVEGAESFTFTIELEADGRTWPVTADGHDPEQAFQDLTAAITESLAP